MKHFLAAFLVSRCSYVTNIANTIVVSKIDENRCIQTLASLP